MNQTLNFQHQKVTGVSETVNSTETGDTALVVCHYYGIKQVSEAEPLGRAALRALSPDNATPEHIPVHPSVHTPSQKRHGAPGAPSFHCGTSNSTAEQGTFRTYVAVALHTHNFSHSMFTGAVQGLCDGEVKDRMQKWTVGQDPSLAPWITPLSGGTPEGPPRSHWH